MRGARLVTAMVVVALAVSAAPAAAAPVTGKQETAARIKREIDALDNNMEIAVEDFNDAAHRNRELLAKIAKNRATLSALAARTDILQASLAGRAESMYRSGPLGTLDVLLGVASFDDFATTWDLLNQWNEKEASEVAELRASRAEVAQVAADLAVSQANAKAALKVVSERRRAVEAALAKRQDLLRGVEAEIAALLAAERSKRTSRKAAYTTPSRGPRGGVVDTAMRYLGRPYRWAATGPGSFDCSGFTMFVYAKVGVSLPHSSRAQYSSGQRVSRADLRPGDLVFFGRPIHHVGIYVGGGQMIHSPRTGDVVSIDPLLGDYVGAARP